MRRLALFISIACGSFTLGLIVSSSPRFISGLSSSSRNAPALELTKEPGNASIFASEQFDLTSEISFERIYDGCEGGGDRKIVIQRDSSKRFFEATVTETDLQSKAERQGKLDAYYFNNLLRLIEEQGYFTMNNQYAMGWVDGAIVKVDVSIGERHKTIKASNEGDVPIRLWGIYYAIEGTLAHVDWQTSSESPQSKRLQRPRLTVS